MKQLSAFLLMLAFCLTGNAGEILLVKGSVDCLKDADKLMIEMDCSQATYLGENSFNVFLNQARRVKDWKERSLDYFFEWFNDETKKITAVPMNNNNQFKLLIVVKDVQKSGRITADIKLIDTKTDKTEAIFFLKGSDGDNDDEITLRDPMKDAGETMGKYLKKNVEKKK